MSSSGGTLGVRLSPSVVQPASPPSNAAAPAPTSTCRRPIDPRIASLPKLAVAADCKQEYTARRQNCGLVALIGEAKQDNNFPGSESVSHLPTRGCASRGCTDGRHLV